MASGVGGEKLFFLSTFSSSVIFSTIFKVVS